MILADIYVPSVNESFEFMLDENAKICDLIEEIVMILQIKTEGESHPEASGFVLCCSDNEELLYEGYTLREYGIRDGAGLLLV